MFCPSHLDVSLTLCHLWLCVGVAGPEQVAVILSLSVGLSTLVAVVTLMLWTLCSAEVFQFAMVQSCISVTSQRCGRWSTTRRQPQLGTQHCVLCCVFYSELCDGSGVASLLLFTLKYTNVSVKTQSSKCNLHCNRQTARDSQYAPSSSLLRCTF